MKTVIGLFSKNEDVEQASVQLNAIDLTDQHINVLTSETAVRDLLQGHQSQVLMSHIGWGVLLSLLLFGLYNLIGLVCDCGLMVFNFWIELDVFFLFLTAGVLIMAAIAYFVRTERLNSSLRPYTYNVKHGSIVVAVDTSPEQQQTVIEILYQHHGAAIRPLETRLNSFRRKKSRLAV